MQADFRIRPFAPTDYDPAVELWRRSEGVELAEGDSREDIIAFLQRNPGLSRVAESEGRIVGAVLCGHDARRGLVYHLAVDPSFRSRGLGRQLVTECLSGLRTAGVRRAILLVAADNTPARAFWEKLGFEEIALARPFGIDL